MLTRVFKVLTSTLQQLLATLVGTAVLFLPGALLAAALRLENRVHASLLPAAWFTLGIPQTGAIAVATLLTHRNVHWAAALWAVSTVLAVAVCHAAGASLRRHLGALAHIERSVWWVAGVAGVLGYLVGGLLDGDALYHTAYALKLRELPVPSLSNTQMFDRASPHPGYLVPALHEAVAIISLISRASVPVVMWVLPTTLVPAMVMAFAGLGNSLLPESVRCRGAATAWAFMFTTVMVNSGTPFWTISVAMWPGTLTLYLVLPLVLVTWFHCLEAETRREQAYAFALVVACMLTMTILHVSYLLWFGLAVAGHLLLRLLCAPITRREFGRLVGWSTALLAVALAAVATTLPALRLVGSFGEKAGSTASSRGDLEFFELLFVGGTTHFRLRADYLVGFGGITFLCACGTLLAVRHRREPVGMYMLGSAGLVFALTQSQLLFPLVVAAILASQAIRLGQVLPLELGGALLFSALIALMTWAYERDRRRCADHSEPGIRWLGGAIAVAVASVLVALTWGIAPLSGRFGWPQMPEWPVRALGAALVLLPAALLIDRLLRRTPTGATTPARLVQIDRTALRIAVLIVIIGTIPVHVRSTIMLAEQISERSTDVARIDRSHRELDPEVVNELRDQPRQTVLMARPFKSFAAMGQVPIYAVAYPLQHTHNTERNLREQRLEATRVFFRRGRPMFDGYKLRVLSRYRADLLLVSSNPGDRRVRAFVRRHPDVFRVVATGRTQRLYEINRPQLQAAIAATRRPARAAG